jgi:hypothetical protein
LAGEHLQILAYAQAKHPKSFAEQIARYEKTIGRKLTKEELADIEERMESFDQFELLIPKHMAMVSMQGADELQKIFFAMKWSILTPETGYFITSDNPITRQVHKDSIHPFYGDGGFSNKTVEVSYPLSPKRMLLLIWTDLPTSIPCPKDFVDRLNSARAGHAERYLYAHIHDRRIVRLAQKFKSMRSEIKISGLRPKKFAKIVVPRRMPPQKVPPQPT